MSSNSIFKSQIITITLISFILSSSLLFAAITANLTKYVYSDNNNDKAPDFNLKTLDGKYVSLYSFKGKPTVLWFMAAWCPSCVGQADAIKKVKSEFGNKVNVFVIDMWSSQAIGGQSSEGLNAETGFDLKNFLAKYGSPEWEAAVDTDRVTIKYGIIEVDSTIVIDGDGNILLKHLGPSGYQPIRDVLSSIAL